VTPELRQLLAPYLATPVRPSPGQTREQALNFAVASLHHIVQTYEGYDGLFPEDEVRHLLLRHGRRPHGGPLVRSRRRG
jgi:hypothetical protein